MSHPLKFYLPVFLVLLPTITGVELDCGARGEARENSSHTLTCSGLQPGQSVVWIKLSPDVTVASCDGAAQPCQKRNYGSRYDVTRTDTTASLTILDVHYDDNIVAGKWRCVAGNSTASCTVSVVFLPVIEEYKVDKENDQVVGRCQISKVFPEPTCHWYQQFEGEEREIANIHTSVTGPTPYPTENLIYYRATCHLRSPLPTKQGSYQFKLLIIPGHKTYTTSIRVGTDSVSTATDGGDGLKWNASVFVPIIIIVFTGLPI